MANFVVFFAGSGQKVKSDKHVYDVWGSALWDSNEKYIGIYNDGVGEAKGTSALTGKGWAKAIEDSLNNITSEPDKVVVVGMSRGGVQALIFAHCLNYKYPNSEVFIFAIDPVQGAHFLNDGSFDMRDKRNIISRMGFRGTRGDLKRKYNLKDDANKSIPVNVKFYLSTLAQFKGSSRTLLCWGFTPQAPRLGNLVCPITVPYKTYELIGDHSFGVYTGIENGGINKSRQARGKVTFEMFAYHLNKSGFAQNFSVGFDQMQALEYYCLIAMEDLSGSQGQKKSSGYSFLEASRKAGSVWGDSFTASAKTRVHKGRGHLVKSLTVISAKGYFVNQRHKKIYDEVLNQLSNVFIPEILQNKAYAASFKMKYPNILPWLAKNAEFGLKCDGDKKSFDEFNQLIETMASASFLGS